MESKSQHGNFSSANTEVVPLSQVLEHFKFNPCMTFIGEEKRSAQEMVINKVRAIQGSYPLTDTGT